MPVKFGTFIPATSCARGASVTAAWVCHQSTLWLSSARALRMGFILLVPFFDVCNDVLAWCETCVRLCVAATRAAQLYLRPRGGVRVARDMTGVASLRVLRSVMASRQRSQLV